ncbi:MAG: hypothetical protein GY768_00465 [Planctomycetaceae bacterium]|nr:hypothetical protein [Planctomycetaceae bacterium]
MSELPKQRVEEVILEAIRMTNMAREADQQLEVSADAILYSRDSKLDSLGLVGLLIDVEEGLRDEGLDITLNNEQAMSQKRSPFRDVQSLVEYISTLTPQAHTP